MIRVEKRRSSRVRHCDGCGQKIPRGENYLAHDMSPDHVDVETADLLGNGAWQHLAECSTCAVLAGRGDGLDVPLSPDPDVIFGALS